jgi:hypothetical protein
MSAPPRPDITLDDLGALVQSDAEAEREEENDASDETSETGTEILDPPEEYDEAKYIRQLCVMSEQLQKNKLSKHNYSKEQFEYLKTRSNNPSTFVPPKYVDVNYVGDNVRLGIIHNDYRFEIIIVSRTHWYGM